jgi:molybdate transport system substrate-binding protein
MKHWLWTACCLLSLPAGATELRVAVAANFLPTMEALAERFGAAADHDVLLSSGSTGKLYAQIVNGAPYDLFFAADTRRPALVEANGAGIAGSRFSYAFGRLVLWSPDQNLVSERPPHIDVAAIRFFAIANPELAPYGAAARETLLAIGAWQALESQLVRGENVNQAFQFVMTGNAEAGLIARSQLTLATRTPAGSSWVVPQSLHAPIEQQAVLLSDSSAARSFAAFVQTHESRQLIRQHGYDLPE